MAKWNIRKEPGFNPSQILEAEGIQYTQDKSSVIFLDQLNNAIGLIKLTDGMVIDKQP